MPEKKPFEKKLAEQWKEASERERVVKSARGFATQFVAQAGRPQKLFAMREFRPGNGEHSAAIVEHVPGDSVGDILEGKGRHLTKEEFYKNAHRIIDGYAEEIASNYLYGVSHGDTGIQNVIVTPKLDVTHIDWDYGHILSAEEIERPRYLPRDASEDSLTKDYGCALDFFIDRIARSREEQVKFRNRFHRQFTKVLAGKEHGKAPLRTMILGRRPLEIEEDYTTQSGYKTKFAKKWPDMRAAAEYMAKKEGVPFEGKSLHEIMVELRKKDIFLEYKWGEQTA